MEFSKYQNQIFDFIQSGEGSAVILASAGAGKTTTIVECANRISSDLLVTFVAFNKRIAEELNGRLPTHVRAQTLNALGYRTFMRHVGRHVKLEGKKTQGIMSERMSFDQRKLYGDGVRKLVGLAKAHGIVPKDMNYTALMLDSEQNWVDLLTKYDVEFENGANPMEGIEIARKVLRESIELGERIIDFDDQLYLPTIWQARFLQHDVIFVDEAQDVNPIQRAMLKMSLKPGGRLLAVGDISQAIYAFRGADTDAIGNIKKEFDAVAFPLSISYRCPKAVVREARKFVSTIEPSETAPEGIVQTLDKFNAKTFEPADVVLCRLTYPLIALAFTLMKEGRACRVLGRDIGEGLVRLIKKMEAESIDELELNLMRYQERETQKLMGKGKEEEAERISDRVSSLFVFTRQLPEGRRTVDRLVQWIKELFSDETGGIITLSTVHKAKGLEWPRVFILDPDLMFSKWSRQDWQKVQDRNVFYVAITRAQEELYYIDSKTYQGGANG